MKYFYTTSHGEELEVPEDVFNEAVKSGQKKVGDFRIDDEVPEVFSTGEGDLDANEGRGRLNKTNMGPAFGMEPASEEAIFPMTHAAKQAGSSLPQRLVASTDDAMTAFPRILSGATMAAGEGAKQLFREGRPSQVLPEAGKAFLEGMGHPVEAFGKAFDETGWDKDLTGPPHNEGWFGQHVSRPLKQMFWERVGNPAQFAKGAYEQFAAPAESPLTVLSPLMPEIGAAAANVLRASPKAQVVDGVSRMIQPKFFPKALPFLRDRAVDAGESPAGQGLLSAGLGKAATAENEYSQNQPVTTGPTMGDLFPIGLGLAGQQLTDRAPKFKEGAVKLLRKMIKPGGQSETEGLLRGLRTPGMIPKIIGYKTTSVEDIPDNWDALVKPHNDKIGPILDDLHEKGFRVDTKQAADAAIDRIEAAIGNHNVNVPAETEGANGLAWALKTITNPEQGPRLRAMLLRQKLPKARGPVAPISERFALPGVENTSTSFAPVPASEYRGPVAPVARGFSIPQEPGPGIRVPVMELDRFGRETAHQALDANMQPKFEIIPQPSPALSGEYSAGARSLLPKGGEGVALDANMNPMMRGTEQTSVTPRFGERVIGFRQLTDDPVEPQFFPMINPRSAHFGASDAISEAMKDTKLGTPKSEAIIAGFGNMKKQTKAASPEYDREMQELAPLYGMQAAMTRIKLARANRSPELLGLVRPLTWSRVYPGFARATYDVGRAADLFAPATTATARFAPLFQQRDQEEPQPQFQFPQ